MNFLPEFHLLLAMSHPGNSDSQLEKASALLNGTIDWPRFMSMAKNHRMSSILSGYLKRNKLQHLVPPEIFSQLEKLSTRDERLAMMIFKESIHLSGLLNAQNIRHIHLKGPSLAYLLHGEIFSRHSKDIDVLIHTSDRKEFDQALVLAGYALKKGEDHFVHKKLYASAGTWASPSGKFELETHVALSSPREVFEVEFEKLYETRQKIGLAGSGKHYLETLGDHFLFIYLCVHVSLHGWLRMKWIHDIACLATKLDTEDWKKIALLSEEYDVKKIVEDNLYLCGRMYGTPLDEPGFKVFDLPDKNPYIDSVINAIACRNADPTLPFFHLKQFRYFFRKKKDRRVRSKLLQSLLISKMDYEDLPLPPSLYFLYVFLRIPLAIRRRFTKTTVQR